jgi:PAS domain S-box-containing protein
MSEERSRLEAESRGNETVIAGQKEALELALHGAPLHAVLEAIARTVESQSTQEVLASILLLDAAQGRLRHGAAPSLPRPYNEAIDGLAIGPAVGSCGTAAFTGETVVVRDVATDPLWADFKDLALVHGLRACWSTPILSSAGEVLGTFALYHRVPVVPSERDREIVRLMSSTAALIIERDRAAKDLAASRMEAELARRRAEESERGLAVFIDNLPELAWTARPDGHIDYYNRRWYEYTGTSFEEMQGWGWKRVHDPEVLPEVVERWKRSLATGEPFEMEFPLRGADGTFRWFLTRVAPVRDAGGRIVRWFGTNTNIDTLRAARALTVAVAEQSLDAQEMLLELRAAKERAEARVAELEAREGGER